MPWTILKLICHFYLDYNEFHQAFGEAFPDYFANELVELEPLVDDGLLEIHPTHIKVIDNGQLLVRNICMVFDAYLKREDTPKVKFSQTI